MKTSKYKMAIKGAVALMQLLFFNTVVFADTTNKILESKVARGGSQLLKDLTVMLTVLAPIIGGVLIIVFLIKRSGADEHEQKRWNNRIFVAVTSVIGVMIANVTLNTIISYFV